MGEEVAPSEIAKSPPVLVYCYPPVIEPFGGKFTDHASVTLKSSQKDSTLFYTLDGGLSLSLSLLCALSISFALSPCLSPVSVCSYSLFESARTLPMYLLSLPPPFHHFLFFLHDFFLILVKTFESD